MVASLPLSTAATRPETLVDDVTIATPFCNRFVRDDRLSSSTVSLAASTLDADSDAEGGFAFPDHGILGSPRHISERQLLLLWSDHTKKRRRR